MLYNKYTKKMKKALVVKNFIIRFRVIISITLIAILGFTGTYTFGKGSVYGDVVIPPNIEYGDQIRFNGSKALFGDVYYEYCKKGTDVWTTEAPSEPGTYYVRAVGTKLFRNKSYGDATEFEIEKRLTLVEITSDEVEYGKNVEISVQLLKGHTLQKDSIKYITTDKQEKTDIGLKMECNIDLEALVVLDGNGVDVSDNYNFNCESKMVNFLYKTTVVKPIEITGITYNNQVFDGDVLLDNIELENNDVVKDIKYHFEQNGETVVPLNAGVYDIIIDSIIVGNGDEEHTSNYNFKYEKATLTIDKKEVEVTTQNLEKVFDGNKLETNTVLTSLDEMAPGEEMYVLVSGLCETHYAIIASQSSIINVKESGKENTVELKVFENEVDVTNNYEFINTFGTLTITPRSLTITPSDISKTYDGTENYSFGEFVITDNLFGIEYNLEEVGYSLELVRTDYCVDAGEYSVTAGYNATTTNELLGEFNDNYTCEVMPCNLTINKRPITLQGNNVSGIYSYGTTYGNDKETIKIIEGSLAEIDYISNVITSRYSEVGSYTDSIEDLIIYRDVQITDQDVPFGIISNIASNYEVTYIESTIEISKLQLNVKVDNYTHTYDKTNLDEHNYNLVITSSLEVNAEEEFLKLVNKDLFSLTLDQVYAKCKFSSLESDAINVGAYTGEIVGVKNSDGEIEFEFETENYTITKEVVNAEVKQRTLNVSLNELENVTYDGQSHEYDNSTNNFILNEGSLEICEGDEITISVTYTNSKGENVTPINSDTYTVSFASHTENDENSNYIIEVDDSIVFEILKKDITLLLTNQEFIYGDVNTNHDQISKDVSSEIGLVLDDEIVVDEIAILYIENKLPVTGKLNVGSYYIVAKSYNFNKGDSNNYNVYTGSDTFDSEKEHATLTITPKDITIDLKEETYIFNGLVIEHTLGALPFEGACYDDSITVKEVNYYNSNEELIDEVINAGDYFVNVKAIDDDNANNYNVTSNLVNFKVEKKALTLKPTDQTHTYDKTVFTSHDIDYLDETSLVDGDMFDVEIKYYQSDIETDAINAGTYVSKIDKVRFTNGSKDNYEIAYQDGTLEIFKRQIEISLLSQEVDYNGNEQSFDGSFNGGYILINDTSICDGDIINVKVLYDEENLTPTNVKRSSKNEVLPYQITYNGFEENSGETQNYEVIWDGNIAEFTINPINIELKLADQTFTYGVITHETYDEIVKSLVDEALEKFVSGESISVTKVSVYDIFGNEISKLNVGDYIVKISEIEYNEGTLECNYNLTYSDSNLTINPLDISVDFDMDRINIDSEYKHIYDGNEVIYVVAKNNFELRDLESLPYVGTIYEDDLALVFNIINNDGHIVSHAINSGSYHLEYSYYMNFNYGVNNYNIINSSELNFDFEITPKDCLIQIDDLSKKFNNQYYTSDSVNISENQFINTDIVNNFVFKFKDSNGDLLDSVINVGTYEVVLESYNCNGTTFYNDEVYKNYNIIIENPEFEITPQDVVIRTNTYSEVYNGNYHQYPDSIDNYYIDNELYDDYVIEQFRGNVKVTVKYFDSTRENELATNPLHAGSYYTLIDEIISNDLSNYNIVPSPIKQSFNIEQKDITISFKDYSKQYDKQTDNIELEMIPNSNMYDTFEVLSFTYVDGIQPINVGIYTIDQIEYSITNILLGDDSKGDYNVTFKYPKVTITAREISISLFDIDSKVYDGIEVEYVDSYMNFNVTNGSILDGDELKIEVTFNGAKTAVNSNLYILNPVLNNSDGTVKYESIDGLKNYSLSYIETSQFEITPKDAYARLTNAQKEYDGAIIRSNEISYVIEGLLETDNVSNLRFTFNGKENVKDASTYDVECTEYYLNGIRTINNDYRNYNIIVEENYVINKKPVTLQPNTFSHYYTGSNLTYEYYYSYIIGTDEFVSYEKDYFVIDEYGYYLDGVKQKEQINVNNYKVKIERYSSSNEILNLDNYEITLLENDFIIYKRPVTIQLQPQQSIYTGSVIEFEKLNYLVMGYPDILTEDKIEVEVTYSATPIEPGEYEVYYQGFIENDGLTSNYEISCFDTYATTTLTIAAREIKVDLIENYSTVYNGEIQKIEDMGISYWSYSDENDRVEDGVEFEIILGYRSYDNIELVPIHAQTYYLFIKEVIFQNPSDKFKYSIVASYEKTYTYTIEQKEIEIEINEVEPFIYDNNNHYLSDRGFTVIDGLCEADDINNVYLSYNYYKITEQNEIYTYNPKDAGTYKAKAVWIGNNGNSDYKFKDDIYPVREFKILPKEVTVTFNNISSIEKDYELTPTRTPSDYDLPGIYHDVVLTFKFKDKDGKSYDDNSILDASTYDVIVSKYSYNGKEYVNDFSDLNINYHIKVEQGTFEISKRTINVIIRADVLQNYKTSEALDGKNNPFTEKNKAYYNVNYNVLNPSGSTSNYSMINSIPTENLTLKFGYKVDGKDVSELYKNCNSGTYTFEVISYSLNGKPQTLEGGNYQFNITNAEYYLLPRPIRFDLSDESFTYNGKHQGIGYEYDKDSYQTVEDVKLLFTYVKEGNEVSECIDAGVYTATYTGEFIINGIRNNPNYEITIPIDTETYEIEKRTIEIVLKSQDKVYNGNALTFDGSYGFGYILSKTSEKICQGDEITIKVKYDGLDEVTNVKGIDEFGKEIGYVITYIGHTESSGTYTENQNYIVNRVANDEEQTFTITQKDINVFANKITNVYGNIQKLSDIVVEVDTYRSGNLLVEGESYEITSFKVVDKKGVELDGTVNKFNAGTHYIIPTSVSVVSDNSQNYNFVFEDFEDETLKPATLEIAQRTLFIKLVSDNETHGGAEKHSGNFEIIHLDNYNNVLVYNDTIDDVKVDVDSIYYINEDKERFTIEETGLNPGNYIAVAEKFVDGSNYYCIDINTTKTEYTEGDFNYQIEKKEITYTPSEEKVLSQEYTGEAVNVEELFAALPEEITGANFDKPYIIKVQAYILGEDGVYHKTDEVKEAGTYRFEIDKENPDKFYDITMNPEYVYYEITKVKLYVNHLYEENDFTYNGKYQYATVAANYNKIEFTKDETSDFDLTSIYKYDITIKKDGNINYFKDAGKYDLVISKIENHDREDITDNFEIIQDTDKLIMNAIELKVYIRDIYRSNYLQSEVWYHNVKQSTAITEGGNIILINGSIAEDSLSDRTILTYNGITVESSNTNYKAKLLSDSDIEGIFKPNKLVNYDIPTKELTKVYPESFDKYLIIGRIVMQIGPTYPGDEGFNQILVEYVNNNCIYETTNEVGTYQVQACGDPLYNYSISNYSGENKVTIDKYSFKIKVDNITKTYDSLEVDATNVGWKYYDTNPLYTIDIEFTGKYTDAGSYNNTYIIKSFTDMYGNPVDPNNVGLQIVGGKVTITARQIKIVTQGAKKVFDGTPLEFDTSYNIMTLSGSDKNLLPHHTITINGSNITEAVIQGNRQNSLKVTITDNNGKNVTSNYNIIGYGQLVVTPFKVRVVKDASGNAIIENGKPLISFNGFGGDQNDYSFSFVQQDNGRWTITSVVRISDGIYVTQGFTLVN